MLKKDITYTDFNDQQRTDTLYFNLSKTDILSLRNDGTLRAATELSEKIKDHPNDTLTDGDVDVMLKVFRTIILKSYGERSDDGRSFVKIDRNGNSLATAFEQTAAYDQLFMSFLEQPAEFTDFLYGVMPKNLAQQVAESVGKDSEVSKDISDAVAKIQPTGGVAKAGLSLV